MKSGRRMPEFSMSLAWMFRHALFSGAPPVFPPERGWRLRACPWRCRPPADGKLVGKIEQIHPQLGNMGEGCGIRGVVMHFLELLAAAIEKD